MSSLGRVQSVWTREHNLRLHTRLSVNAVPQERTPIVLVHGLSVSSRYMVPTARQLAPYRRVYAPDLPGFGLSMHPREILDIPALADALVRRMDAFYVSTAVMVGNSMGCQIIIDLALRYPDRISQAVLVGPTIDPVAPTVHQQAWRLFRDGFYESPASILTQSRDYLASGPRRTIQTLLAAIADPVVEKLPHVHVPTLVVRGEHDTIAPQPWVETVAQLLPHSRLVVLPHAPHAANYDAPDALVQATLAFLGDKETVKS